LQRMLTVLSGAIRAERHEDIRATFEREVEQLLDLRAVRLRELRARFQARLVTPTRTADSIVLGVPVADPHAQGVLEASCNPARPLGEPEVEILATVAQLGGLVLEIARGRPGPARVAAMGTTLVGSTEVMQVLRDQVQRVASTDFTVLIEGGIDEHREISGRERGCKSGFYAANAGTRPYLSGVCRVRCGGLPAYRSDRATG
jgi:hypothetical protein